MSEMVERVEDAIQEAGMIWKGAHGGDNCSWADIPNEVFARAAIEAMREPTVEMVAAAFPCDANEAFSHGDKCLGAAVCLKLGGAADVGLLEGEAVKQAAFLARDYRLMIDEALKVRA